MTPPRFTTGTLLVVVAAIAIHMAMFRWNYSVLTNAIEAAFLADTL